LWQIEFIFELYAEILSANLAKAIKWVLV